MNLTEVYVYRNGLFIIGKVRDVRKLLAEYAGSYDTVYELIKTRLN
ncbi:hypothetical protein JOC37_001081 [Desulfohalotomaculum tongense]|nr:hypothetical protein [Desulforadius tongensis]MBM7854703.1 hypothetical protein [Desulforadius tongensis]